MVSCCDHCVDKADAHTLDEGWEGVTQPIGNELPESSPGPTKCTSQSCLENTKGTFEVNSEEL